MVIDILNLNATKKTAILFIRSAKCDYVCVVEYDKSNLFLQKFRYQYFAREDSYSLNCSTPVLITDLTKV